MTIGKKLYRGFALILGILALLLFVNLAAIWKARSASAEAAQTLESVRTIESVRFQMMTNRLNLNNFLLSGDPRDEEKVNRGITELSETIRRGQQQSSNDFLHTALVQVEGTETTWADNFAKPLLAERHQVDSGDSTVSDLQIFYLQKDPSSWLGKTAGVLDQANADISKALAESQVTAYRASFASVVILVLGTLFAIVAGWVIAVTTAKSITDPLHHLITVAREIGDSGDLDQNIDIHRTEEISALATPFKHIHFLFLVT